MRGLRAVKRIRHSALASAALGATLIAAGAGSAHAAAPVGAYTTKGAWSFVSAPKLHPPKLSTDAPTGKNLAHGDFLLDNFPSLGTSGPMTGEGGPLIVDNRLQPVWFHPVGTGLLSANLQQETYQGEPVLVRWQGLVTPTGATTRGEVVVVDLHYRQIAAIRAHSPWLVSLHDAVISGPDIWVTVYRYVRGQNLAAYGGPRKGTVYDAGFQEYDLKTGKLLYTWDALNPGGTPNLPLSDSEQPASARTAPGGAWDAYHVNSLQVLPGNEILMSMRNTWAAYLVNTATSQIAWKLGGKRRANSFTIASNARFAWQHEVQMLPDGDVTLYDDDCCRTLASGAFAPPNGPSQGLRLKLDLAGRTASLVAAYRHAPARHAAFLGSMQLLDNGNALVGWGSLPYFSEYTGSGKLLLDAVFPGKDQTYRALYSSNWVGAPYYPPSGAARTVHGRTTVYASWNGATQVASWQVLAGPTAARLTPVVAKPSDGFETATTLKKGTYKVFEVRALDGHGQALGTSRAFPA
jgi:hypothetical protein